MSTPRLPKSIVVTRKKGDTKYALHVDGEEFPYMIDGVAGANVKVGLHEAPQVTITLLAESVQVRDDLFVGADLTHVPHDDEDDQE